jgi:hypothetical protein
VIQAAFRAALMTLVGAPLLLTPRPGAAFVAAIAMPSVTVRAKKEGHQAVDAQTNPLQQYRAVLRHASAGGLDNGTGFVSVWRPI